jgi:hypothetical protein
MRTFAIINTHDNVDILKNIIEKLPENSNIFVFQEENSKKIEKEGITFISFPSEIKISNTKIKNFVSKYFFEQNFKEFLHVLEDSIVILNDTTVFLDEIEKMMTKLNQKSWFNTVTDPCNYAFKVYNPRFSVEIDEPSAKMVYDKTIYWTSHANTSWICYDYSKASFEDIEVDESFSIPMYYIIKFLAQRRNNKKNGELYYMNFYPTIKEELGVFKGISLKDSHEPTQEEMIKENQTFENMKINHGADMSIEQVMDDMFALLKQ